MFEKLFYLWLPKTMQFRPGKFAFSVTELEVSGSTPKFFNFVVLASATAAVRGRWADMASTAEPEPRSCKNLHGTPNP